MLTNYMEYEVNGVLMQGFMARKKSETNQPIVLIVHDWGGCREVAQERAKYFAEQGYVGFAVDMYGKGKRGSDDDLSINQKLMNEVLQDRAVIIDRLQAALEASLTLENVNPSKIIVIGFCFGGLCALDFARSGSDVNAVISVHGVLNQPEINKDTKIKCRVLALHGYADKSITPEQFAAFQTEMTQRDADWQVHVFGNVMHSFTNPNANDVNRGLKFDVAADAMTWKIVKDFMDLTLAD